MTMNDFINDSKEDYKKGNYDANEVSKEYRPRLRDGEKMAYFKSVKTVNRVLVIGDLHEPFCLDGYLEFCKKTYYDNNCNKVVFIGDIIDSHFSSYHETDTEALSGNAELELTIDAIAKWYEAFPIATVVLGNHDRIVMRKAQTSAVPLAWIKDFKDVLNTPNWKYVINLEIDGVMYTHGLNGNAYNKCKKNMQSTVQGHYHTLIGTQWFVGSNSKIFGCQVGCGIDKDTYAMMYARDFGKPAIGCAVITDGKEATNILMEL